jgi:ketosteroid isomerase-like protein
MTMTHPNETLTREALAAFQRGDMDAIQAYFAPNIVWHVPGRGQLAGDFTGVGEVLGFFGKTMELSNGTFRLEVHDVLANDEHAAVLSTITAEREGRSLHSNGVQILHIQDGRAVESWLHPDDQYAVDEFWA